MYKDNRVAMVDSYKSGQWQQVPKKTTSMFSYMESRGSTRNYDKTIFFGLQFFLKRYYSTPIEMWEVEEAKEIFDDRNEPFNYEGWKNLVEKHKGFLPIRVRALPEGTIIPTNNVLFTVESTDEEFYWLPDYVETAFCRAGWYGTTVATQSYYLRELIYKYLQKTADDPDSEILFKLHDFGARGASSKESAAIGGAAHQVIFRGSDTIEGVLLMKHYYNEYKGLTNSIAASQHSTISSWGREHEVDAYRNMLNLNKGRGIFACVSDTWDIYNACENLWGGELRDEVINSGAVVVIRPDSGNPVTVLCGTDKNGYTIIDGKYYIKYNRNYESSFYMPETGNEIPESMVKGIIQILADKFGYTVNSKGYKVLNYVRVIQGDGVNPDSIAEVLETMTANGWSTTNIAFGMGGALLQKVDRDTNKFAYKCSSATIDGKEVDVYKQPITDPGKNSKKGRLDVIIEDGEFKTVTIPTGKISLDLSQLVTYYENGQVLVNDNFSVIRERASLQNNSFSVNI